MPKLIDKQGNEFWFITDLDGPWQVTSSWITRPGNPEGEGHTVSEWGIVDVESGKYRKVGRIGMPKRGRVNFFDRAKTLAKELNAAHRMDMAHKTRGYDRTELRDTIRFVVESCITDAGSACYNMGVPGLCRRIEEINKQARRMLEKLDTADRSDFFIAGVVTRYAVRKLLTKNEVIDLRSEQDVAPDDNKE